MLFAATASAVLYQTSAEISLNVSRKFLGVGYVKSPALHALRCSYVLVIHAPKIAAACLLGVFFPEISKLQQTFIISITLCRSQVPWPSQAQRQRGSTAAWP